MEIQVNRHEMGFGMSFCATDILRFCVHMWGTIIVYTNQCIHSLLESRNRCNEYNKQMSIKKMIVCFVRIANVIYIIIQVVVRIIIVMCLMCVFCGECHNRYE